MKNLGKYYDVYCMIYCIQLSDKKENFSMNIHERFKLGPLSFVTLKSLSRKPVL